MTIKEIEAKQQRAVVRFELAKQIRQLLDDAKKAYGKDEWDEDDMDAEISALVFEEA